MLPSGTDIKNFQEIAQSGKLSRAAERLGVTQPALTLSIKRLEERVGAPLLIREKTGVRLTRAGDLFLERSHLLLEQWESLRADLNRSEKEVSGVYSMGVHASVALFSLPSIIPTLAKEFPSLELQIDTDLSRHVAERIISGKLDFGIVVNPVRHPDTVIKTLCRDEVTFYQSKRPGPRDVLIADLNLVQTQVLIRKAQKQGHSWKRLMRTPNLEVVAELTAAGAGVGILPGRVANRIRSFKMSKVSKKLPSYADQICLVYKDSFRRSESARLLMRRFEELFDPEWSI